MKRDKTTVVYERTANPEQQVYEGCTGNLHARAAAEGIVVLKRMRNRFFPLPAGSGLPYMVRGFRRQLRRNRLRGRKRA